MRYFNILLPVLLFLCNRYEAVKPVFSFSEQEEPVEKIILDLFRLRNEHKADSAGRYFADTVKVYMKYLRNVSRSVIINSDRQFWKQHPENKFVITSSIQIRKAEGVTTVILFGKEYLDGVAFKYEKIEIRLDRHNKIFYYRGFNWDGKLKGANKVPAL